MRVVIDTNYFLAILPKKSIYRPIFDAFRQSKFELAVSSEILDEYAEIFEQKMNAEISANIIELILKQPNSIRTEIFYRWELITADYDDNKFVDSAISANADFIVTSDKHYNVLEQIPFPSVKIISLREFLFFF
ncbi:hypothetical protein GCM10011514_28000 [Emticicia aquatilis]|uniref:PIN domain-containing protein n=1 Tax=Emticicia aquatilis TaxID=1537369 RepID=A0A916YUD0_9BACT|nr:putative toxin-antitoxin system toxin component, PIN family [Emticicia aquatilis]GGD62295.1 hypothetical protein GCM10011514_28000 [Emticicia aquatilis]